MSSDGAFPVDIERLAYGGDGVGHREGKVVFVPGGLPGERALVRTVVERPRYVRAELVEILTASGERRVLDCRHESEDGCGGCGLRHAADEVSLDLKARAAVSEVRKIAADLRWPNPVLHPTLPLDGTRTWMRFHQKAGRLGLHRQGTHQLVPVPGCLAAQPEILKGASDIEGVLQSAPGEPPPATVQIEYDGSALFAVWSGSLGSEQREGLRALVDSGRLAGVRCRNRSGRFEAGRQWIEETAVVAGRSLDYRRRVGTFAQPNRLANQALRERLHALLAELAPRRTLDLFAGSGNLSLVSALSSAEVLAVELDRESIEGIAASAEASALQHVMAYRRDLRAGFSKRLRRFEAEVVVLDPSRAGAVEVMEGLRELGPKHIVYVSCSPPHMARDAGALAAAYEVVALEAFDMFPRTAQVELMAQFQRL